MQLYSWDDFNIFTLTELTDGHPLEVVATQIINDLDLPKQLNLDMGKFRCDARPYIYLCTSGCFC